MGGGERGGLLELGIDAEKEVDVLCSLRGDFWFGWDGLHRLRLVGWLVGWSVGVWDGSVGWRASRLASCRFSATSQM